MSCPPATGEAALLSSPPECRKTSRASWSDMSIRSICSSMSTFTSMDDMLPIGSGHKERRWDLSQRAAERSSKGLSPGRHTLSGQFVQMSEEAGRRQRSNRPRSSWMVFGMGKHVHDCAWLWGQTRSANEKQDSTLRWKKLQIVLKVGNLKGRLKNRKQ